MGLQLRHASSRKVRVIATLVAVFALVAQPLYGVVSTHIAHAITSPNVVVTPDSSNGWMAVDDNEHGGSLNYVAGPDSAPLGSGSAQLKVTDTTQGYMIFKSDLGGTKLSDLSTLSYKTYVQSGNNLIAPTLQLNIDRDTTDANTGWQGRLVYEPYMNGSVNDGQWQTWDATAGKYWLTTKSSTLFDNQCGQGSPCTISELTALFPNIGINGGANAGIGFKAGSTWTNFVGNVDAFTVNNKTYDFEPASAPGGLKFTATNLNGVAVSGCNIATNNENVVAHWDTKGAGYKYRSWTNAAGSAYNSETSAYVVPNVGANSLAGALSQGEGDYWFEVQSVMSNGDLSLWSSPCKITYDKTAPAAPTLVSPGNNTVENGVTLVNKWSSVSDAVKYTYQSYNNAALTAVRSTVTTTNTEKSANNVANGTVFWWRVKAIDAQGNESGWSDLWKVTIDNKAPSVPTGGAPHDAYKLTNTFNFTWNASTDNQPDITYEFQSTSTEAVDSHGSLNGAGVWNSTTSSDPAQNHLTSSMIPSYGAPDGKYYWQVRAIDAIGNKSAWSQVWNMTIDQVNPTLDVQQPANGEVFGGTDKRYLTVKSVVSDATSGLSSYHVHMDGIEQPTTLSTNLGIDVVYDTHDLTNGIHTIKVSVFDKAGRSTETTRTIFVDKEAPTATLEFPGTIPGATSFKVKFSEDVKKSEAENPANYFLHNWPGGGKYEDLTPYATVSYDQGTTTATVTFSNDSAWYVSGEQNWGVRNIHDLVGNELASTDTYSTKMTNPVIENLQSNVNQKDITWTWSGVDPTDDSGGVGSGIKNYMYRVTKEGATDSPDWLTTSNTFVTTSVPTDGNYTLHVKAADNAGNTGNEETNSVSVDTTGPVLTINEPTLNEDGTYRVSGTTDTDSPITVILNGVSLGEAVLVPDANGDTWTWVKGLGSLAAGENATIKAEQNDGNASNSASITKVFPVPAVAVSLLGIVPGGSPATNFASIFQQPTPQQSQTQDDDTAVLGAKTDNTPINDMAALAATSNGWKIFGLLWYWWALLIAALAAITWWMVAAAKRRAAQDV